ncbi:polyribonucleotide nucleotidyltransferase [Candidatus Riesia sp. GBBU]|nr:polyribonucleotide nucleotidyltransferase [Candidatus Riesia sp. GBBU]
MFNQIKKKFRYGKHTVLIETGVLARQATTSVVVSIDDTTVLVTVVEQKTEKKQRDFFPLTVNYQERSYAAGKIPGSFFRREGRPGENEMLISRLIDRPIRPLFPIWYSNEIQIIATVLSVNPDINPDIVSIIGASTALSLSNIPFNGPIGASRIGLINNELVLNPDVEELKKSKLDLIVSGTSKAILMVESKSDILKEDQVINAIIFGHEKQQIVIDNINDLVKKIRNEKSFLDEEKDNEIELYNNISSFARKHIRNSLSISEKENRKKEIERVKEKTVKFLLSVNLDSDNDEIDYIFSKLEKEEIRRRILDGKSRTDGRKQDEIRKISSKIGILPRTHGSSLFTRGDTQALVTVTLGTDKDAQIVDGVMGEHNESFLFHYNFPPYSVGEIGNIGFPKRREIGHGKLAKKSFLSVIPNQSEFPYTIRVVSEITESNGSSSMASICGASLALMDAGVPIKSSIAGIAMGLIKEKNNFVILTDISGEEDHIGDMDFKVAGNQEGISALQMDIKIQGITKEIITSALNKAKIARLNILEKMRNVIDSPKGEISKFAPRIHTISINPNKIGEIIGKGGSVIKSLTEETGATIEIKDNGLVRVASSDKSKLICAIRRIKEIVEDIKIGKVYKGKIVRVSEFGVFVIFHGNKEGLVHKSQILDKEFKKFKFFIGKNVSVKVTGLDKNGKARLNFKTIKNFKSITMKLR